MITWPHRHDHVTIGLAMCGAVGGQLERTGYLDPQNLCGSTTVRDTLVGSY